MNAHMINKVSNDTKYFAEIIIVNNSEDLGLVNGNVDNLFLCTCIIFLSVKRNKKSVYYALNAQYHKHNFSQQLRSFLFEKMNELNVN